MTRSSGDDASPQRLYSTGQAHRVAIIGVGSPFGTDQAGWLAVERLQHSDLSKRYPALQLQFVQADRPGALLLELLRGADAALVIDAMQAGLLPGTLRTFTHAQLFTQATGLFSSHAFGITEALALGQALGGLPQHMAIIGIEVGKAEEMEFLESTLRQLMLPVAEFLSALQAELVALKK